MQTADGSRIAAWLFPIERIREPSRGGDLRARRCARRAGENGSAAGAGHRAARDWKLARAWLAREMRRA